MDDDLRDHRIAAIATKQHGIVSLAQSDAIGFTADQREFRVRAGRWEVVHPRVFRIAGSPPSWKADVLAACWSAEHLAVASHRSAAAIWDLPGGRTNLIELTSRRWKRTQAAAVVVHETKRLDDDDYEVVDGIPTTRVPQTLLGLAAVLHSSVVELAFDRALQRGLTTNHELEQFVTRKGKRGRNGIGVLRALVRGHDPLAGAPESAMETKLKQLLRRHDFPAPVCQFVIRDGDQFVARVDAAYPELCIAIEFDSFEHHTGKLALVRDTDRRNRLLRLGWQTVTFTADDLRRDGGPALQALRGLLPPAPRFGVTDP